MEVMELLRSSNQIRHIRIHISIASLYNTVYLRPRGCTKAKVHITWKRDKRDGALILWLYRTDCGELSTPLAGFDKTAPKCPRSLGVRERGGGFRGKITVLDSELPLLC